MGDVVRDVAKFRRGWGGGLPETACGRGSTMERTEIQREWIPQICHKYHIKTIADVGAGDLHWISKMQWVDDVEYTPYDLVPRHNSVTQFDLVKQVPPAVDLLMCLWVLNHLPMDDSRAAIANLKSSGAKYLMMTDRPIWREEQPKEIEMPYIERLELNHKNDSIMLIKL